jgi:LPXTG-site transpeptidase (sortase) family protein
MRRRLIAYTVAAVTVGAAFVFIFIFIRSVWYAPGSEIIPALVPPPTAPTSSEPVRLQIPTLGIDASVEQVGVNAKGEMGIPTTFTTVAWYKYGPPPGQLGSAVIDGHVDNGLSLPGVFKHLGDLKVGDHLYVVTKGGDTLHFVVDEIAQYPYATSPAEKIFARTDAAWLNLITCSGTWMKGERTYSDRLVVYTKFVDVVSPTI